MKYGHLTLTGTQSESSKAMKPLIRKLKKCRDPDRVDLVALQKARREQALDKSKAKGKGGAKDDGSVFGQAADLERESKRRKVATNGLDDPFGPPLGAK